MANGHLLPEGTQVFVSYGRMSAFFKKKKQLINHIFPSPAAVIITFKRWSTTAQSSQADVTVETPTAPATPTPAPAHPDAHTPVATPQQPSGDDERTGDIQADTHAEETTVANEDEEKAGSGVLTTEKKAV